MKKKFLGLTCFALALCATVGGTVALNVSAETNAEGWELRDDGYYYEVDPPVYDLFDWEYDPEGDVPPVRWYKLNQTGSVFSNNLSTSSREALTGGSVTLSTSQGLYPQYDSWGKDYFFQGSQNQSSDEYRHMDFTFMVDFTNLNAGYFVYFSHTTKISFQLSSNHIIVEEKEAANGTDHKSWANMQTTFLDFPTSMKDLTGWQQVTVLIEDRVEASVSEITRGNNKGARVTVTIGENSVSTIIDKMGYYYGIYGIENNTGGNLPLKSIFEYHEVSFESNGGSECATKYLREGKTYGEAPIPEKGAYEFMGWYSSATFEAGTEYDENAQASGDAVYYAKWIKPSDVNADGWVLGEDNFYHNPHLIYKDIFDEVAYDDDEGAYNWYQIDYTGTYGQKGFVANSRTAFDETNNVLPTGKMLVVQGEKGMDYVMGNATWVLINPSSFVDYDFAFEMDFTNITSGMLRYINDNIYIYFDFTNDKIIIENREAAMKYEDWSWPTPREHFEFDVALSSLTGKQTVRLMIDERVKATREEMTREGNNGAVVTIKIGNEIAVRQVLGKLGYYLGILGFINDTNADIAFTTVKTALIKEQIQDYVKESNYTSETWTKLSAYIAQAVAGVDSKERSELDAYYAEVTKTIDAYTTALEESAREAKKAETLASLARDYVQTNYSEQDWSAMQALITAYETAIADTARADEIQALYDELVKKLNAYFTLAETQEKNELVAELNGYGKQSDYDEETWTEICLVKAEYLLYIENATSIWDVRQLVAAAKVDVDSFVKIGDSSYQPSVSGQESGCGSFVGISAVALTTAVAVATFALRRKED